MTPPPRGPTLAAVILAACVTACGPILAPPPGSASPTTAAAAAVVGTATATDPNDPQAVYVRFCAACHGSDGIALASLVTPNLNSQGLLTTVDDQYLYDSTALGRPGPNGRHQPGTKMTAYKDVMTEKQLRAVVTYMRRWQTAPSVVLPDFTADGDVEAGRRIYQTTCVACHGATGWGEQGPRLAGEVFQQTTSDALIRHTIRNGRPGSRMPAHLLSDKDLDNLVTYIRTLDDVPPPLPTAP